MTASTAQQVVTNHVLDDNFTEVWTPTGAQVLVISSSPSGYVAAIFDFARLTASTVQLAPTDTLIIIE